MFVFQAHGDCSLLQGTGGWQADVHHDPRLLYLTDHPGRSLSQCKLTLSHSGLIPIPQVSFPDCIVSLGKTWSGYESTRFPPNFSLALFPGCFILQLLITCSMKRKPRKVCHMLGGVCDVIINEHMGGGAQWRILGSSYNILSKDLRLECSKDSVNTAQIWGWSMRSLWQCTGTTPCLSTLCLADVITRDQFSQASPLQFWILQAIKNKRWKQPGNEANFSSLYNVEKVHPYEYHYFYAFRLLWMNCSETRLTSQLWCALGLTSPPPQQAPNSSEFLTTE